MKAGILAAAALALSGNAMNVFSWTILAQGTSEVTLLVIWGATLLLLGRNARLRKRIAAVDRGQGLQQTLSPSTREVEVRA